MVCVLVDVARHTVVANAGHPAPVLVDADGARLVAAPLGPPIGVLHPTPPHDDRRPLADGGTLLAFTDGLFEQRRDEVIDVGLARVVDVAGRGHRQPLDELVATILREAGAGSTDDTVIVGFRWVPLVPSTSGPSSTTTVEAPSRSR